ncbi:unnamed protein product [Strongylus vulgaris]|uniref:Uncharacterized protein n=1 Tax=Strongylus vulgaris TaxID=40348 RepID=A0A3P7JPX2_STRVU|nr:unnamed protein product [Strongylus vulgaris]
MLESHAKIILLYIEGYIKVEFWCTAHIKSKKKRRLGIATPRQTQAVRVDNTIYVSGSLGLDPKSGELKEGVKEQAHQSLKNIGEILKAAGVGYGNVVKTTVLLANINDFATVNDIYKEYFTSKYPARAAYQVAALPKNALVEIEAIAVAGEIKDA